MSKIQILAKILYLSLNVFKYTFSELESDTDRSSLPESENTNKQEKNSFIDYQIKPTKDEIPNDQRDNEGEYWLLGFSF